jgi:hypothetical protein
MSERASNRLSSPPPPGALAVFASTFTGYAVIFASGFFSRGIPPFQFHPGVQKLESKLPVFSRRQIYLDDFFFYI